MFLPALSTQWATPQLGEGDYGAWDLDRRDAALGAICPHPISAPLLWVGVQSSLIVVPVGLEPAPP